MRTGLGGGTSEGADPDEGVLMDDEVLFFEDGVYRKSAIGQVYDGDFEDMHPMDVRDDELEELRDLAERYEENLAAVAESAGDVVEEQPERKGKGSRARFDPAIFDVEEEEDDRPGKRQ